MQAEVLTRILKQIVEPIVLDAGVDFPCEFGNLFTEIPPLRHFVGPERDEMNVIIIWRETPPDGLLKQETETRLAKVFEQGRRAEAQQNLTTMTRDLEAKNRTLKDERITRKIVALNVENRQMTTAAASPDASQGFLKASKQRLYQAKQGNRQLYSMKPGDTGIAVEQLQQALKDAGFYKGPIDGKYDDDSIDITGDHRAIYKLIDDQTAFFTHIGTHSQLYR